MPVAVSLTEPLMNKNRTIFYLVFAIFHVCAFIFTLLIQDFDFIMKMTKYLSWFKFFTFFGLAMIVADVVWSLIVNRESQKEKAALTHELNTLKAKLFDLQETAKASEAAAKIAPKN